MSHFPNMFKSTGTTQCYLIHVGSHEACAVFALDKRGNISDFTAGQTGEALGEPLRKAGLYILRFGPGALSGYRYESWHEWCNALNMRSPSQTQERNIAKALYDTFDITDMITCDHKTKVYSVTEAGLKQDAKND